MRIVSDNIYRPGHQIITDAKVRKLLYLNTVSKLTLWIFVRCIKSKRVILFKIFRLLNFYKFSGSTVLIHFYCIVVVFLNFITCSIWSFDVLCCSIQVTCLCRNKEISMHWDIPWCIKINLLTNVRWDSDRGFRRFEHIYFELWKLLWNLEKTEWSYSTLANTKLRRPFGNVKNQL